MSVAKVVIEAGRTRYVVVDGHGELVEPIAHYLKYLDLCGMARNTLRTLRRRSPYPGVMYRHLLWLTTYSSTRDWPRFTMRSSPTAANLDVYAATADELVARPVLDLRCGTGTFGLLIANRGLEVTRVDPADGSLGIARAKPGSERVNWVHGDATALPPMQVDLATTTGNVAQAIVDPTELGRHVARSPRALVRVRSTRDASFSSSGPFRPRAIEPAGAH